ncbi:hypothetical protein F4821DRAFT_277943 [Hypoxylon rubiginosum]|uniref:Uncharacterized protein n=1 Tax=Hypoxylon rubiginosum TaxID=110542 RepID=A0ACC0DJ29_9PEZI|nr:hypothetical protein F4821DRAFT_277943 [Hypoxylon rubiginosum]
MSGQFGFMSKIGATDAAVATLNDQPYLFTILVVILVAVILQIVLIWYIHYATMKPEQKKKKEPKDKKKAGGKPPAARELPSTATNGQPLSLYANRSVGVGFGFQAKERREVMGTQTRKDGI